MRTRIITALILLPLAIFLVQWGGWPFAVAILAMGLIAVWEFVLLMEAKGHRPNRLLALAVVLAAMVNMRYPDYHLFVPAFTILLVSSLAWQLYRIDSLAPPVDWALTITGAAYIGLGLSHLLGLRLLPEGNVWVWLVLLCTWGADVFAYFGGSLFGRHKFWPRLSPKKTWEGIFFGILGGLVGGLMVTFFFRFPLEQALIIGLLASIFGPLGDLSVSMIKRYSGVKDSSGLFPGHGGMLDRTDSVIFVAVIIFYYATWFR